MVDTETDTAQRPDFCEGRPGSAVAIAPGTNGEHDSVEVADEGYDCPQDPVGKYRIRVQYASTDTVAFWLCADCRDAYHDSIIAKVNG